MSHHFHWPFIVRGVGGGTWENWGTGGKDGGKCDSYSGRAGKREVGTWE